MHGLSYFVHHPYYHADGGPNHAQDVTATSKNHFDDGMPAVAALIQTVFVLAVCGREWEASRILMVLMILQSMDDQLGLSWRRIFSVQARPQAICSLVVHVYNACSLALSRRI